MNQHENNNPETSLHAAAIVLLDNIEKILLTKKENRADVKLIGPVLQNSSTERIKSWLY